ncbi:MAG: 50S ribosomal protein L10 [Anaerolineaceae bacterium]|nr:50S ribosomal protein L10 [Anaerolineaceae bacterium]
MAITKEQKNQLIAKYEEWLKNSQAIFMIEYSNMNMVAIDDLREKAREIGAEIHVTKNTLLKLAMDKAGFDDVKTIEGTTMCGFAFEDAPALAKIFSEAAKKYSDMYQIKMGYLDGKPLTPEGVKSLANVPPLPVMRAMLLSTILASASTLVRTIAEPARQMAAVVKAYSEKEEATA